jgi:hypothetical protein
MSVEDSGFELHVTSNLQALWEELGVDEGTRTSQLNELRMSFCLLYQDSVEKVAVQCQETRAEIQKVQAAHQQAMKAFGLSETEIHDALQPALQVKSLLQQLEVSKQSHEAFRLLCADRIQKLENLTRIANGFFDRLGTPTEERSEFAEIGETDFSRERIERFRAKVQELKECVDSRTQELQTLKAQITTIRNELQTPLTHEQQSVFDSDAVSTDSITKLNTLLQTLEQEKQRRMAQVTQFAIEITHLWDLLVVQDAERAEFLRSHSTIGEDALKACKDEVARLAQLRDARLPTLIQSQKLETEELWNKLHIAPESRPRFDPRIGDANDSALVREFHFYEAEIVRLKKLTVALHPLLTAIGEREEIVSDYQSVCQSTNSAQRLLSRERGCAQQLMREEKARKRYKNLLPKVEKKLAQMLADYKTGHGTDFEWDGKPYVEQLTDQPAEKSAQNVISTKAKRSAPEKGATLPPSPRKNVRNENRGPQTLSQRGRPLHPG